MKILSKIINMKERKFQVRIELEENTDDGWNIFNLLSVGDFIQGACIRKIQKVHKVTGLVQTERKKITLLLQIKAFEYMGDSDGIRIKGVNVKENQYLSLG